MSSNMLNIDNKFCFFIVFKPYQIIVILKVPTATVWCVAMDVDKESVMREGTASSCNTNRLLQFYGLGKAAAIFFLSFFELHAEAEQILRI